jgi:hypothetical protein
MAFELIQTTTLGTAAATVEFTSIPQDGTDLLLLVSMRSVNTAVGGGVLTFIRPNGSTANFSGKILSGSGSSTSASSITGIIISNPSNYTATTFSNNSVYIPNYAGSTNKSFSSDTLNENNATLADMAIFSGLWSDTAAITSLTLIIELGDIAANSTFSLYKITKGSDGIVTTS